MNQSKNDSIQYFNSIADTRLKWKKRNSFYHKYLEFYYSYIIPQNSSVLEIGCGTGELLHAVKPSIGVGIDFSERMLDIAKNQFPNLQFIHGDMEELKINQTFDYIILSDLVSNLWDIQKVIQNLKHVTTNKTRIIISFYNYLWEPVLKFGESLGLKKKQPIQNWLSLSDIENLLELEGFQIIKTEKKLLFPKFIPIINFIFNKIFGNLPFINKLCLINFVVARTVSNPPKDYSVSIIIPARNEKGNIENAVKRLPAFGLSQEIIFVEGNSSDQTYEEMITIKNKYTDKNIKVIKQSGKGKGNAVREGFDIATGDIFMILDADLTTPPEDLPKFYFAIRNNHGEFINGCRLVYPMEKQAMRTLNLIANKFFGVYFTYLLGQRLKDTLCGTKVLTKDDYLKIVANRKYFGDFDPFGDFDLLFGAAKLNLKITEIIVRYKDREYGSTQISRFKHGWLLIKMSAFAAKKNSIYLNSPMIHNDFHNEEIKKNLEFWEKKPILKKIYTEFYNLISANLIDSKDGLTVELGSGIGNIKSVIPNAICTDMFPNPWIDQVENAYQLSFSDNSVSNIILFDVFHHIEYPGDLFIELQKVLKPHGRCIIFEPAVSLLGCFVYGVFHHEPLSLFSKIKNFRNKNIEISQLPYYSAQGNSSRIFSGKKYKILYKKKFNVIYFKKLSALTYAASGGYSKKQLYPNNWYPFLKKIEFFTDYFPILFATRNLIVLEKK